MFKHDGPDKNNLFTYYSAHKKFIGILSIPHSGEDIPKEIAPYLTSDLKAHKEDVDYRVNDLVDIPTLQKHGIAVLVAHIHRVAVDLNRDANNCVLYWKKNTQGVPLVLQEPTPELKEQWITTYYRPYYEMMKGLISHLETLKNPASFVDLHSMPSRPTEYHLSINPNQKSERPDFCLSDRHGKTCAPEFIGHITQNLAKAGYVCTNNDPYVGGYITEYADKFKTNNIQIEIKRAIYMDEKKKELETHKVEKLKPILTKALIELFEKFA
ncbi:MAG: N-formylglutamate amidohydrolase [Bacteriovoracaceae bacterium]|nr:N-formylglutamate amidohydrolase [Bacteriovoracaceae bacterium]